MSAYWNLLMRQSQKITAIASSTTPVGDYGGASAHNPEQISILVCRHAGNDARIGIETGVMTPWLVHELRNFGLEIVCLEAGHARAARPVDLSARCGNWARSRCSGPNWTCPCRKSNPDIVMV
jgi:hypothetical protein